MSVSHDLATEVRRTSLLKDELLRRFPSLADDEAALSGTLEGLSNIDEQIAAVVESIEEDEALIAGLGSRMAHLTERAERLTFRVEQKKAVILYALTESGIQKLQLPTVTLSQVNNPPSVVVVEEKEVPEEYWVHPEPPAPRLDKKTLLADLKSGKQIPGVLLSNPSRRLGFYTK